MSKGTPSQGKKNKSLHIRCRRCGNNSFHKKQEVCSSCGFGRAAEDAETIHSIKSRKSAPRVVLAGARN
jgi:large subunit ribosomal protein L37e